MLIFIENERIMPIDFTKIQRYYMFVYYGSSSIGESELQSLYYLFGDEIEPEEDSAGWKNYPTINGGADSQENHLYFDRNVTDGHGNYAISYYVHEPGQETLIHSDSWVWVKFSVGQNTYIKGEPIGDQEVFVDYPLENTQYIGTSLHVASEPDPPTPSRKYKIWTLKSSNNANIVDEGIWVGNNPGDANSKQTSGHTYGPDYAYVEFTWDELTASTTDGIYISYQPSGVKSLVAESQTFKLTVLSNSPWTIEFDHDAGDLEWCTFSQMSGTPGSTEIYVTVDENQGVETRTGFIVFLTTSTPPKMARCRIVQAARIDNGLSS